MSNETRVIWSRWIVGFQVQVGEAFESFVADEGPPGSCTHDPLTARNYGSEEAALDEANRIRTSTRGVSLACAVKVETRLEVLSLDEHFRRLVKTGGRS